MPVKIFALLLLAAAGWEAGGEAAKKQTEKYKRLCGVLSLLRSINDGIRFARTGLYEIFSSFHNEYLEKCGFLGLLTSSTFVSLDSAWKNAVECLDTGEEARSLLLAFGEGLGKTNLETQSERTELCISRISRICEEEGRDLAKKVKSYRALGLLASLAAAIILY